jgi:DNA-binding LytR/AlgR family response regulator
MAIRGKYEGLNALYNITEKDVTFVEQDKDYHLIYTLNSEEPIRAHGTLASAMQAFPSLIKPHKSYLVNLNQVYCVANADNTTAKVVFRNGMSLLFTKSRELYQPFIAKFENEK